MSTAPGNMPLKYKKETQTVELGGRTVVLENLTPVLPPDQRDRRKREIEGQLYEVFRKYKVS